MAQTELAGLVPDAPAALRDILDSRRGCVLLPIRSEIFGPQRFAQHGRSLGATHRAARASSRVASFFPRLQSNIRALREAHHYIGVQASTGYDISPAGEWLLDNFHLIEAQLREIHEGLPRSYFRTLPMLLDEPLAGLPRVYGVAWAFVAHTDGAFDDDLLLRFLDAYQESRELSLSELWALPTTLRVVLVENLRRLAERVATNKAAREVANLCFDQIQNYSVAALDQLLALLNQRGVGLVFLGQMVQRVQDHRTTGEDSEQAPFQLWLRNALPDFAATQAQYRADQAADNLSVSNAVTSLRAVGDADWPDVIASTSTLMRLLLTSPVFEAEDVATRDQSLHAIELLATRSGRSEVSVAQSLLALMSAGESADMPTPVASHWLRGAGRPALLRELGLHERAALVWQYLAHRLALPVYLACLGAMLGLMVWTLLHHQAGAIAASTPDLLNLLGAALLVFPASEAVVAVINRLISESVRPQHLPRLAFVNGITPEHRVMVAIPAMLSSAGATSALLHRLHLHYLANPEQQAQFALLTDWLDADTARTDSDQILLDDAALQVRQLNARYPRQGDAAPAAPRFILLHRERLFCQTEQRWIGWERKRGKLELLVNALAQGSTSAFVELGAESLIDCDIAYLLTLDSDTQLPTGRLRELVGVAAHPHNQPRLDASGRRVLSGYGILQPRVATPLPALKDLTLYHWLFAGKCGIDPYSAASSEVYQDVFSEGTFTGKGLLNVRAVYAVLSGRLPQDQVLSHDLLEGSLARCAAVTDIALIEDAPFHVDVAASRIHRWMRGDWQLLPFLLRARQYQLSAINRWKMFDNLRRSLVAPMSLLFVLLALAGFVVSPWTALALVLAAFSAGPLMGAVAGFSPSRDHFAKRHFYREAAIDLARAVAGGCWHLALLLQQSALALDAIARALYRMTISRRHLLEWTTAATAQASASTGLAALARQHWSEPVLAAVLLAALLALATPTPVLATMLCLLWAASPVWTWWGSRTRRASEGALLRSDDRVYLHAVARDTWRLFERSVGADDQHLPPDNLQVTPHDMLAHRTSPTNIGLYLLSAACARQFGWIGTQDLLARLEATLATLRTLPRHRGHFLNWYDTQTGAPLLPMYVSTVDSGNLSGHLLALAQSCLELARAPYDASASQCAIAAARQRLQAALRQRCSLAAQDRLELKWQLADHRASVRSARLDALAGARPGDDAKARLLALAHDYQELAWQADFSFLYHRKRHLLHIGYRVAEQQRDAGFYDLLASESRLTSVLAIAKGDIPVRHWSALGRPFFAVGADAGLRSWSGSMFEYLMPGLVLDEPHGSVLHEACGAALSEQMSFARQQGVPWGISESAYAARDHTLAYQYAPQGVPRLALRRMAPDELVVAPYATALAAQIEPRAAALNFAALETLGARGRYGFIDAIDYSVSRRSDGELFIPVNTFMAHHQGMSIVALANLLLGSPARRWGMANEHIEAVSSLLHEQVPREVSIQYEPQAPAAVPARQRRRAPGLLREVLPGSAALEPTHLLSNGRYSVSLRANGAGWSRWGQLGITRARDDALRDEHGSFLYLRWDPQAQPVSVTQHPAPDPSALYQCTYHSDRVCFAAAWPELQSNLTVWVSPEDDIEFRQIELRNLGNRSITLELMSAFDVTLADPRADEAHSAFGNLFVRAEWLATHQALLFERKPRLATEQGLKMAHFLADADPQIVTVRLATDRQRWRGRNRAVDQPQALLSELPQDFERASTTLETGLDPVCVLAVTLRLAPHTKARLTFATTASENPGTLRAIIDKYRQHSHVQRSSLMSATLTGIRLRSLRVSAESFAANQTLTTALLLSLTRPQGGATRLDGATTKACDRRLLWRFAISGERPIILISAGVTEGLGMLRALAQALSLWAWAGIGCDLVVVNSEPASYFMALQREIVALSERHKADCVASAGPTTTGFYVLRADELSGEELGTLQAQARVRLHADGRSLSHHVKEWAGLHQLDFEQRRDTPVALLQSRPVAPGVVATSVGDFDAVSGEFRFEVSASRRPQRPWINVLSNPAFGGQISETGGGYSWAVNSRLNQLTGWSNDPVADPPGEWFLLQNSKTREVWSLAPGAWGAEQVSYAVSHGQGYSTIRHRRGHLEVLATWCVDARTAVKQVSLQLLNHGPKTLHLRLIGMAEWLMGASRADRGTVHTEVFRQRLADQQLTVLLCTQRERSAGFGAGSAFFSLASALAESEDWTCDRRECFDADGRLVVPDQFGQRSGDGLDPCAALATRITLLPGKSLEKVFLLGYAENFKAACELAGLAATVPATLRLEQVRNNWNEVLGSCSVKTPDPLFDVMVNRWLLYQTVSCRLWAKAGFYQAGGATGFRDQLQDAMALAWAKPDLLRQQIVLCASRQFVEGDVQHWWHAPLGAGVRTHFSDDLLWLAYATHHYLHSTGDITLADQQVAFLEGSAIAPGAEDAYYTPTVSAEQASVYEHAARAIDRSLRIGAHGLPLMGSGDWNDGMNQVGPQGRGESVWLGWFLCRLVADFAPLARSRGDTQRAQSWEQAARGWQTALLGPAWDGQWFKRAFFDDGQVLGSQANPEARIDLIAQAWSVLSQAAPLDLQRLAMASLDKYLVDPEAGLIKLIDPPLVNAVPSAGYIQAYPPGVRENGGQYSHAGVWALMAQAELANNLADAGDGGAGGDLVYRYFTYLSPAHRAAHPTQGLVYGVEPYVMAGDVYSQPPYIGRGGWSWYTGAAAWMHRAAIESIFGLHQGAQQLAFKPCLPSHWKQAELTLVRDAHVMRFILVRAAADAAALEAGALNARLLLVGQLLHWSTLPAQSCFVIPLLGQPATAAPDAPNLAIVA